MATPWKPDPGRGWGPSQGQIPGLGSQTPDEAGVQVRGRFLALEARPWRRLGSKSGADSWPCPVWVEVAVPLFMSLAPCPVYLQALNICSSLSRRLTNGATPSCHPTHRKVIAVQPASIPTTPCIMDGAQEATWLPGTAGPGDLLVLSTKQQFLSKHITLFMGFF